MLGAPSLLKLLHTPRKWPQLWPMTINHVLMAAPAIKIPDLTLCFRALHNPPNLNQPLKSLLQKGKCGRWICSTLLPMLRAPSLLKLLTYTGDGRNSHGGNSNEQKPYGRQSYKLVAAPASRTPVMAAAMALLWKTTHDCHSYTHGCSRFQDPA